jgi:hypothetical protein
MSEPSAPVKITCPECQGCINLEMDLHAKLLTYRCQVGHSYSLKDIIKGKEIQVENHIWTVMGLLEHLEFLYEKLLQEPSEARTLSGHDVELIHERLACLARQKKLLRTMAVENQLPPLNDGD